MFDMSNQPLGYVIDGKATCIECNRVFNLFNVDDADEWYSGHDCEVDEEDPLPASPTPTFSRVFHRMSGL
jgi:hypothetical protein